MEEWMGYKIDDVILKNIFDPKYGPMVVVVILV